MLLFSVYRYSVHIELIIELTLALFVFYIFRRLRAHNCNASANQINFNARAPRTRRHSRNNASVAIFTFNVRVCLSHCFLFILQHWKRIIFYHLLDSFISRVLFSLDGARRFAVLWVLIFYLPNPSLTNLFTRYFFLSTY